MQYAKWFSEGWRRAYDAAFLRHGYYSSRALELRRRWKRIAL